MAAGMAAGSKAKIENGGVMAISNQRRISVSGVASAAAASASAWRQHGVMKA
jgi:hypothetical protein